MQAIETKYLSHTNTQPSRIKAICARGSLTLSIHSDKMIDSVAGNDELNHVTVANELINKIIAEDEKMHGKGTSSWSKNREFVTGSLKNGNYVHVFSK
jgi:hypothetical protein